MDTTQPKPKALTPGRIAVLVVLLFAQGLSVYLLGKEAHGISTLTVPAFSFVILVLILFWVTKQPTTDMVISRHEYVREEVARVADQLKTAQGRYEEFSGKLGAIDAEIRAVRDATRQDAEAARVRILNEAKRLSTTIISDAQTSASALYGDLRTQLRLELGNRVIERAAEIIRTRLTTDDRARIRRDFSRQVEQIQ